MKSPVLGQGVGCHCRAFKQVGYMIRFTFQKESSDNGMENRFARRKRREEGGDATVNLLPTSPSFKLRVLGSLLTVSPFLRFTLGS